MGKDSEATTLAPRCITVTLAIGPVPPLVDQIPPFEMLVDRIHRGRPGWTWSMLLHELCGDGDAATAGVHGYAHEEGACSAFEATLGDPEMDLYRAVSRRDLLNGAYAVEWERGAPTEGPVELGLFFHPRHAPALPLELLDGLWQQGRDQGLAMVQALAPLEPASCFAPGLAVTWWQQRGGLETGQGLVTQLGERHFREHGLDLDVVRMSLRCSAFRRAD